MNALIVALVALAVVALIGLSLSVKVVTQYQRGVLFRLGLQKQAKIRLSCPM
jgi:regulator of protease activity HflC (stomatin/prohibitin superfamily)